MSGDALEMAILKSFLRDTDFSYLEELTFPTIPDGGVGRAVADQMLRWHGLYRAIRSEFPNMPFHEGTLNAIWDEDFIYDSPCYQGPLMGGPEYAVSGWYGGPDETVAAAFLGQQGHLEAVIVTGIILCHSYTFYSGDGRPLIDGYQYLLPAVASYTSVASGTRFSELDIPPGWYDSEHYGPNLILPNPLTRVLNPKLSEDQRRLWISSKMPKLHSRPNEEAWVVDVGTVGAMLKWDFSFLTPDELREVEAENRSFIEYLCDPEFDPQELPVSVDTYFTAYLVATYTERLMNDALNCPPTYPESLQVLSAQHPWISEWARESWRDVTSWPAGSFKDALMSSGAERTSGWFRFDSEGPK